VADLELKLRLSADNSGLVQVLDASGAKVAELGSEGERAGRQTEQGFGRARKGVESVSEQLGRARQQLLAFIGVQLSGQLIGQLGRLADEYTTLNSRIALVTDSQAQANETFDELFDIAQRTRAELSATGELFTTLARSTSNLGLSQQQLLQITETINQSFIVSGASADSARAAITQLSQGLAAGALRGEEFNSVAEQAPILMDLLGQSLDMTRGELREFAAEGGITSEILTGALLQGAADVQEQFDGMQITIAGAKQQLDNAFTRFVGESADASGAARLVADSISGLANNLETVVDLATAGAVVLGSRYVAALAAARAGTIANTAAEIAHAAALARTAGAAGVASGAVRGLAAAGRGLLAVFGGPFGLLLTAGSLALVFRDDLREAFGAGRDDLEALLAPSEEVRDALAGVAEQLQNMEPGEGLGQAAPAMRTLQEEVQRLRLELSQLEADEAQFAGTTGGASFGDFIRAETERRAQAARDRIEVLDFQIRLAQQLAGEAEFEDITLLIEGLGRAADFAAPLLERFGLSTKEAGPTPEQQAAIDKLTGSIREQITQLQQQQIELTAGKEAAAAFEDALLAADLAARAEAEGVELSTEKIQALVAERRRLIEANEDAAAAQRRATEAQREAERANDAAFESLRSLVEEFERSEQAAADFELRNQRLAAELGGPVAAATFDYSLAIREALELLERGDITVEQFRQRVALLREEFERSTGPEGGFDSLGALARRFGDAIVEGADLDDALGRSLRAFGGQRVAQEFAAVVQDGVNAGLEALDLSDDARANLAEVAGPLALAIGQAIEGNLAQSALTAAGTVIGSFLGSPQAGAAIGNLLGGLFGGDKVPKFQVSGANTAAGRDIGPNNQDPLDTALGTFFLGLRKLDAETEDAVANALVGFASTIAGVVRETDLLAAIEAEIANTRFSSRSDGESLERLVAEVFGNVLNALDAGVAAFVRRGANLEEQIARFEAAFAVSRRLVGRRGLGLSGAGFESPDPITDPIIPPEGGGGGGGVIGPGRPPRRVQSQDIRQFEAAIQGVGDASSVSNPALLQTLDLLDELQVGSESLVDTFNRLVGVTQLLDRVVALTGTQIGATREEMVRFGADLVAFFGDSAEALGQQLGVIFDRFFTDEERLAAQADTARERFGQLLGDLGVELTEGLLTEGGFRQLFDELSGILSPEDLAVLIEAGVALDAMLDAEEALAEARGQSARDTERLADLMAEVNGEIFALTRSPLRASFRELRTEISDLEAEARELGASEAQLGRIRQLEILRQREILDQAEARLADLAAAFLGDTQQTAAAETSRIEDVQARMEERYRREIAALERIGELVDSLLLSNVSPLTPREQEAEARRQLNEAFAAAEAGDIDALESLPGLVNQFLEILNTNTGGVGSFPAEFQAVLDRLASLEAQGPQTRPPGQRPPTAADVSSAAGDITAGLESLEQAQLASEIIDVIGLLAQRTDESPSEIADRLGLPLDALIEAVSGELPAATGEALRSFFDELVIEADRQLSELAGIQETLTAEAAVRELIADLTQESLSELRKITALLEQLGSIPIGDDPVEGPAVPGFAAGGFASGLVRTGEQGRELILPNPVTEFFVRNGIPLRTESADGALLDEIRALRQDVQTIPAAVERQSSIMQIGNRDLAAAIGAARSERDRNRFIGQPSRGGASCGAI